VTRTLVFRAGGTYELTGAVAALAVEAILRDEVPPGANFAAEVLPTDLVERLRSEQGVQAIDVITGGPGNEWIVEDGAV
jgi:hypothetical protein